MIFMTIIVLKIIFALLPFVPSPLLYVNGCLVSLLPVSIPNIVTDPELVKILTPDTIRKLP